MDFIVESNYNPTEKDLEMKKYQVQGKYAQIKLIIDRLSKELDETFEKYCRISDDLEKCKTNKKGKEDE